MIPDATSDRSPNPNGASACPLEASTLPTPSPQGPSFNRPTSDILQSVTQVATTTPFQSWSALQLEQYFGAKAQGLTFKEMLLPFVWVARQQLIAQVGSWYQLLSLPARASLEYELLVTLDALCQPVLLPAGRTDAIGSQAVAKSYCQAGWGLFVKRYPDLTQAMTDSLILWIRSTIQLLDDLNRARDPR